MKLIAFIKVLLLHEVDSFIKVGVKHELGKNYRSYEFTWSWNHSSKFPLIMKLGMGIKVLYSYEVSKSH